jgi:hypothetical protein
MFLVAWWWKSARLGGVRDLGVDHVKLTNKPMQQLTMHTSQISDQKPTTNNSLPWEKSPKKKKKKKKKKKTTTPAIVFTKLQPTTANMNNDPRRPAARGASKQQQPSWAPRPPPSSHIPPHGRGAA